jgi:uncharacterized spore protein YtfJ
VSGAREQSEFTGASGCLGAAGRAQLGEDVGDVLLDDRGKELGACPGLPGRRRRLMMDVENLLAKASESLSVRRAFGTAYEKDGMLIIPVALVAGGGGGGTGTARSRRDDSAAGPGALPGAGAPGHDAASQDPRSMDAGGGFGGLVLPSGAYVVKGDQVRWVPAVDVTIVVVASLTLVRGLARTWTRRSRRHRRG